MSSPIDSSNSRLLVTGASGQFGKLVVHHLLHTVKVAPSRIVAGSRSVDKLKELAALGVMTRHLDFNDAASVEAAAQGVNRALLISSDDIFNRLEGQKSAVRAFAAAGVRHVLYTSIQNADRAIAYVVDAHYKTELEIRAAKFDGYTLLRNGLYFENSIGAIAGASKTGQWFSAAKSGKLAAIARDDTARAAAFALARSDNAATNVFEITGAEALDVDAIVADVSSVLEKPIEVVHVSVDDLAHGIAAAAGLPEAVAKVFASFDTNTAEGFGDSVTDDYTQLTGARQQTHAEWLAANKAFLQSL